jgi:hypothetical protein
MARSANQIVLVNSVLAQADLPNLAQTNAPKIGKLVLQLLYMPKAPTCTIHAAMPASILALIRPK